MYTQEIIEVLTYVWESGKRAEKNRIKNFELSTCSRSLKQAEYHAF